MPLVGGRAEPKEAGSGAAGGAERLFSRCANPGCATGWLRLWRSRRAPVFEGRWVCSARCMGERVAAAVRRELDMGEAGGGHRHRLPLGLLLVDQGRMTAEQLREALQRRAASGEENASRLGEWLVGSGMLSESVLTRALSAQWNCPVLSPAGCRAEPVAAVLPRLFSLAFDAVPLRVAAGRLLYLAFAGRVDRSLAYALEGMTGLRVIAGVAADGELREAQARYMEAEAPRVRLLEAPSAWSLGEALTRRMEEEKPVEARLRRVHNWFWLRLWKRAPEPGIEGCGGIEDVVATVGEPLA